MGKRLVIALGGNALGNTPKQQLELVKETASTIVDLVEEGYDVVVGHGNGPQVGMVNLAFENSYNKVGGTPEMPFPECGAMTQGYIGYHLQQSIGRELKKRGIHKPVATVVTQVEVSREDKAFQNPTKPIGSFYTKEEADKIVAETGYTFVEDAGRGYRRVVPSPIPVSIVELDVVENLVKSGAIVITVGGGGIPVVKSDGWYEGVAAVIVGRIPLFGLVKCRRLALGCLIPGDVHDGQFLGHELFAAVGLVDVLKHDLHRRAVDDDVVVVEEEVVMRLVAHQSDVEQAPPVDVKGLYQVGLLLLDVVDLIDGQ